VNKSLGLCALLFAAFALHAVPCEARDITYLLAIGHDGGGGDLALLSNGDSISTSRLWTVKAGLEIPTDQAKTWVTQLSIGHKSSHSFLEQLGEVFASVAGKEAYARMSSNSLEALEFHQAPGGFRAGAGLAYFVNPKVECVETRARGCASVLGFRFNNALGSIVQIGYVSRNFEFGLRYTFVNYRHDSQKFNGSSAGILFGLRF
jgi:hypothetical protein